VDRNSCTADDICSIAADGIVKVTHPRYSYLTGVSNNEVCRKELKLSGVHEVWSTNIPQMNKGFLKNIVNSLIAKGKNGVYRKDVAWSGRFLVTAQTE
jgi:hypothetical protein